MRIKESMAAQGGKKVIDYIWMAGSTTLGLGTLYLLLNLGNGMAQEWPNIQAKRAVQKQRKEELAAHRAQKMLEEEFGEKKEEASSGSNRILESESKT